MLRSEVRAERGVLRMPPLLDRRDVLSQSGGFLIPTMGHAGRIMFPGSNFCHICKMGDWPSVDVRRDRQFAYVYIIICHYRVRDGLYQLKFIQ